MIRLKYLKGHEHPTEHQNDTFYTRLFYLYVALSQKLGKQRSSDYSSYSLRNLVELNYFLQVVIKERPLTFV